MENLEKTCAWFWTYQILDHLIGVDCRRTHRENEDAIIMVKFLKGAGAGHGENQGGKLTNTTKNFANCKVAKRNATIFAESRVR